MTTGSSPNEPPSISKEQDERYVIEHAILLAHTSDDDKTFRQALRDLRTAVAFYEEHDHA